MAKQQLSYEEWKRITTEKCWAWYKREIVDSVQNTGIELVLLKGKYLNKRGIKIPVEKDTREFKSFIEKEYGIAIRSKIFTCEFTLTHERKRFNMYLFQYLNN